MSQHHIAKVISQVINCSGGEDLYTVKVEPTSVQYNVYSQQGNVTGGQMLFQNAPLVNFSNGLINPLFRIRYKVTVSANALPPVNVGGVIALSNGTTAAIAQPTMCLNPLPFQSICSVGELILNQNSTSVQLSQVLPALKRRFSKDFLRKYGSECPIMLDQTCILPNENAGCVGTANILTNTPYIADQPFSNFYSCVDGASRSSFLPVASTGSSVTYSVVEPVFISPLTPFDDMATPLAQLNTLSLRFTYAQSNLGAMFCVANAGAYPAGYSVALDTQAYLETLQYNVDTSLVSIPKQVALPYENVQVYPTKVTGFDDATFSSGTQTVTITSSQFILPATPSLMLIRLGMDPSWALSQAIPTATSLPVDIGLQWGAGDGGQANFTLQYNNATVMSAMSVADLYHMSVKNGLNQSYSQWLASGAPILITPSDFGLDISGRSDVPVGLTSRINVNFTAQFTNKNWTTACAQLGNANAYNAKGIANNLTMQLVCIFQGVCYLDPSTSSFPTGYLTATEVSQALVGKEGYIQEKHLRDEPRGSGLFSTIKGVVNSTAKSLLNASQDKDVQHILKRVAKM